MKKIFLLWFFGVMALGVRAQVPYDTVTVVDPQNFTLATTIDTALVQVISRKANANRRINFQTIKNYSTPDITLSWLGIDIEDTTGTSATYRDFFVTDNEGEVWFVDNAGSARKLYDPAQFQAVTISNDTLYISDGNFAIIPGSSASAIDSISFYGDTLRIYEGGSATPFEVEIVSGGGVTGTGDADRITYWDTDTTLAFTAVTYSATELLAPTLTGAFGLPTGTTAERPTATLGRIRANSSLGDVEFGNGTLFRSVVESMANTFTPGEIGYYNSAGVLTDTTIAAILAMGSGTTGSGVSGRVAYWNGTSSLTGHANFLWDGTELSVGTTNSAYTLDVGTGGVRFAAGANPVGAAGVMNFLTGDWFQGHDGTAWRYWPKADAGSWTSGYIPFSNGSALTTNSSGRFVWDDTAFELELNGDIQFNDNAGKGLYWKNNNLQLKRNGNNLEFVNNTANTRNFIIKNQSTAKFTFVPEANTGVDNSYFEMSQAHLRTGSSGYIAFGSTHSGTIRMGRSSDQITRVRSSTQVYDRSVEFTDSLNNVIMSIGLSGAPTQKVGVNLAISSVTTNFDVNGKARIRNLPDSLYTYEVRANSEGRLVRQSGAVVGAISTTTDASGDVTVTHGMATTPTAVLVTPTGTTAWGVSVHTIGGTTFKVRFYDLTTGLAVAVSTAVTATWLAKT